MLLLRKCPACGASLGPVTVLGPGFSDGSAVVCRACKSQISKPWREYSYLGFLGMFVAAFVMAVADRESLGFESYIWYGVTVAVVTLVPITVAIYYWFPLFSEADGQNDNNT